LPEGILSLRFRDRTKWQENRMNQAGDIAAIQQRIIELQVEHRDLDKVIEQLIEAPVPDELMLRRLKKRKLQLKDTISVLEQQLTPDIPA